MADYFACEKGAEGKVMVEKSCMRVLTIDQGNSSVKAVLWNDNAPERGVRMSDSSIEDLLPLLEMGEIDGCVYCSVGHTDAKFLETLRRLVDGRLLVLTPSTPLPIGVNYGSRATLGNDRVAAAAGAACLFPGEGALVVDAGTAVTLDVVSPEGCFLGGNIAPGMSLRFGSLHDATDRLPLVEAHGEVPAFGSDTVTAIRAGVIGGMVSEIADAYTRASLTYGCGRLVITGNDVEGIIPLLQDRGFFPVYNPNLVGLGLLSVVRHSLQTADSEEMGIGI